MNTIARWRREKAEKGRRKTLARLPVMTEPREASWSAPALWCFGTCGAGAPIPPFFLF
jgi:hypothetical protein